MAAGGGGLGLPEPEVCSEGLVAAGDGVQVQADPPGAPPGTGPVRLVDLGGDEDETGDQTDGGNQRREHQQFVFVFLEQMENFQSCD